jgi:hypothetical protein
MASSSSSASANAAAAKHSRMTKVGIGVGLFILVLGIIAVSILGSEGVFGGGGGGDGGGDGGGGGGGGGGDDCASATPLTCYSTTTPNVTTPETCTSSKYSCPSGYSLCDTNKSQFYSFYFSTFSFSF